jgi:molecular chaperone GrpE
MDAEHKAQLLERFRAYLDQAPDRALPQEPQVEAPDLFTLLAQLGAVKNEVKLESRQVKTALDRFGEVFETLRQSNQRLQDELDRQRERDAAERRKVEQGLLSELLELRDRMQAGRDQAARYTPGGLARWRRAEPFIASMADGMAMNLGRLDEVLARRGVRPLEVLHRPFDPHRMHAVDTAAEPGLPDGVVTEEVRAGFTQDDRVLRPAEVIVNKKAGES